MRIFRLVFTLVLALASFQAFASPSRDSFVAASNIPTMEDADDFARQIIENYRKESAANPDSANDPVLIMHVGNDLPAQLKWIIAHLSTAHVPYEIELVNQETLETSINDARDHAPEMTKVLNYGEGEVGEAGRRSVHTVADQAKLMLRRVFAMPDGFTIWFKLKRTASQRIGEGLSSLMQSAIAGTSLGFSLYLANKAGAHASIEPAVAYLMGWVGVNMYWGRQIADWQGQGRSVTEVREGKFVVKKGQTFFLATNFLKSMITNALVVGGAFGWDKVFTVGSLETSAENSLINLVARSPIDMWINSHQATTMPDGTVVVKEGQWSPKKTIVINTVWNVAYGFLKNLHLLNLGEAAKWTYVVMGVAGGIKMLYDERFWFKHKWEKLATAFGRAAHQQCETLLTRRSALGSEANP